MSEMLEKVARAIADEARFIYERDPERWTGLAEAAVRALREPDAAMRLASKRYKRKAKVYSGPQCYREMIDSILSTPTTRGEVK